MDRQSEQFSLSSLERRNSEFTPKNASFIESRKGVLNESDSFFVTWIDYIDLKIP